MTDLDTAIRARLEEFCVSDRCAEAGKAAILAVLELARAAREDFTHIDGTAYEFARRRALEEAIIVIADKLGVGRG